MSGVREDQWDISVTVAGATITGKFDKKSGGEAGSEDTKYRESGGVTVSLGGPQTQENVTVSRLYKTERDDALVAELLPLRGKALMTISVQAKDIDGNAIGKPTVYTGTFIRLAFPDIDSESNDASLLELECSVDSVTKLKA